MDPVTAGSAIGWAIGPGVLTSFPGAAEAFAQVLISGADVEVGWAGILAALTGSDSLSATILLSNIRSVREKERAVLAVAKSHLPPELFDVLKIGSLALRAHRERRNVFAHSTWGQSAAMPEAIFVVAPERMIRLNTEFMLPLDRQNPASLFAVSHSDVYRAETFDLARREAVEASSVIRHLHMYFLGRAAELSGNVGPAFRNDFLEALKRSASYQAAEADFRRRQATRGQDRRDS